ncbi:protein of unknown function (DUF1206) [Mycolicibacterium chubuense NBB4]|uniref:DUF1206 domain-containing protein n=1 Tax=Mycolicibacterium chubuense (strain NBB4) TaxID=710421 RepID=I4BRQ8_MYCCN|nr:DUF1206 domain-containing protein [Mycolicibacterium chubuense]AFM19965.1 protein of unknown function (DUF1206) [Mycolicibacterium chubuense NBB4]
MAGVLPPADRGRPLIDRIVAHDGARRAARAGFVASGSLHLLIAYLITRIAFGLGGHADPSGAMATLANTTDGVVILWAIAVALVPLALWRLVEALLGLHPAEGSNDPDDASVGNRLKALGLVAVYCSVGYTSVRFAVGSRQSSSERNRGLSSILMQSFPGRAALIAVGVVVAVIGGYYAYKGASRRFRDDLKTSGGRVVVALGVYGYLAEGLVYCLAGILVIVASVRVDPSKAAGLDAAVKTLGAADSGDVLLVFAAVGFAAYGLYSFALARLARM